MSTKTSAGLQDSGTADESDAESIAVDPALSELFDQHEGTDWSEIPGISATELSTWTACLVKAREIVQADL